MADSNPTDTSQTHPYTCNSCAVAFRNSDAQRTHMRTDWHRYNLKRKVADLPPVSSEDYNEKVLAAQATNKATAEQASFSQSCTACQRTYYSENAYQNHINSKQHRLRQATFNRDGRSRTDSVNSSNTPKPKTVEPSETDPEAEAEFEKVVAGIKDASISVSPVTRRPHAPPPDAIPPEEHPMSPEKNVRANPPLSRCLFCNYDSPTWQLSVSHMTKIHGLFIPERQYLTDLEGLLNYLQAKILQNFECISCHKLKGSGPGVQTHMRDKGHCKIAFESEEEMIEVGQFYDFSSTYSDGEEESDEEMAEAASKSNVNGGVKLPGAGQDEDEADEGWETDSSFSSLDSAELTSVPNDDRSQSYSRLPMSRHHSNVDPRPHKNADGYHSHAHTHTNAVYYDEHEMHLPSGRVAGHRSLKNYYRQNLHSYPTAAERAEKAQRYLEARAHAPPGTLSHSNSQSENNSIGEDDEDDDEVPDNLPRRNNALIKRGEAGMLGVTSAQRQEIKQEELRSRKKAQRAQNRYQAKLEKQNNHQKHYRDPLLQ